MGTVIRPELSKKNRYWLNKHRYYELMHFCLQYPVWKKTYLYLDGYNAPYEYCNIRNQSNEHSDPTARCAITRSYYQERMEMIEQTALKTDPELASYIIKAVTEGRSYNNLKTYLSIPCGRDAYYERYRRFFWLLDSMRK